jgi:cyanophycin synthetase
MKIESIKTITGASIYSHQPTVLLKLDLEELKNKKSREVENFNERLLENFPRLAEHFCDRERDGGFVERLSEGTHFNHVVEHLAIELLAECELAARDRKACRGDEKDDSRAVIETTAVETTRYILPLAAEITDSIIEEKTFFAEEKITQAKEIAADFELGPSGRTIVEAAEKRGIPWTRENEYSLVQLGYGENLHFVQSAITDRTSTLAAEMASDKDETKRRLAKFSIPVPDGEIVETEAEAVEAFESIGGTVAVKPLDGRQGKGVSLNLASAEEVEKAFRVARQFSRKVLVEEMFEGKNYRILVVGGKMVAASERLPCRVMGDGVHTIAELIEIENQNPLRGEGHEKPLSKIKITPVLFAAIVKEGWKLEDVPEANQQVTLCGGMNLSTGGTAKDITDEVHESVKEMCERAARVINLDICGVDMVLENIAAPLEKGGIIELNAAPGLRMHTFPSEGAPRDVGGAIVEMLYPNGENGRIPIFAITGTNGKTTVTRMISHVLQGTSKTVGTTTTDGIYLSGKEITKGDTTGPVSAKTILGDPAVEIAVLETARGGIVRRGLGYDWSDIGVITNISEDHIGQDGIESVEDLINIKALIAERVRAGGTLIINADDPNSMRVLEREKVIEPKRKIVLFSLDANNPRIQAHLAKNGTAYFTKDGQIIEAVGGYKRCQMLEIASIRATMNGAAEFQIANSLAAIAACRAFGATRETLARLQNFQNETNNPGRNNLYRIGAGYALVDYGHNAGAFEAICKMAANWHGKSVTGIIGVPGDRDDSIIRDAGRIAAKGFHKIIIKEDKDLRGRARGEIARLLCETVNQESPDRSCEIVLDEVEAFENALREMQENEVVVLFYDKLAPVVKVLEKYEAQPVANFDAGAAA